MIAVAFLSAVGVVVVLYTLWMTAVAYPALPSRVPLQVDLNGNVNFSGPRPAIWIMPLAQIGIAALFVGTSGQIEQGRAGFAFFADVMLAVMLSAQHFLIDAARRGPDAGRARRYTLFTLGGALIGVLVLIASVR